MDMGSDTTGIDLGLVRCNGKETLLPSRQLWGARQLSWPNRSAIKNIDQLIIYKQNRKSRLLIKLKVWYPRM